MSSILINSDVYAGLFHLQDNSIDFAVTSPPYWGQRDYGFEGQIGNEDTYYEYINKLLKVFSLLRKKLSPDGVFFLNIGDKYLSKYGKSPLGFIPYKLAYLMVKDGWMLNEILIWYKPNHMPSSIKNRFANSYEPIFVFSKRYKNIFTEKINSNDYSNILKINLQPTLYKHVAVYPEKLVERLLNLVLLDDNITVLDPFAGSGTTLKVAKEIIPTVNAIMIENHSEYIEIINDRCGLNDQYELHKYDFIPYEYNSTIAKEQLTLFEKEDFLLNETIYKSGITKVLHDSNSFDNLLNQFFTHRIKNYLDLNAISFIGCKEFDIDLINKTALLNEKGWVIRNMIIVEEKKKWFPIFMIVDDNKRIKYIFNYKSLELKSKTDYQRDWNLTNFIGYKVVNSVDKIKNEGTIVDIVQKRNNGFPEYVIVSWDDKSYSKEFVIYSEEEVNSNLVFYKNFNLKEIKTITNVYNKIKSLKNRIRVDFISNGRNEYSGKFKNEKRINWGASPGARSSVEEEFFAMQRLYDVDQNYVADYLNHKRVKKGLTKAGLTNLFPKSYKHTVGHWLRKDFGGSIPTPSDWDKLIEILELDLDITNYVCKTALKIQTVKNAEYKTPDDFINIDSIDIFEKLINHSEPIQLSSK